MRYSVFSNCGGQVRGSHSKPINNHTQCARCVAEIKIIPEIVVLILIRRLRDTAAMFLKYKIFILLAWGYQSSLVVQVGGEKSHEHRKQ